MKNADKSAFGYGFAIEPNKGYMNVEGLTKREYFAAMAMQGLCANYLRDNVTGWNIDTYAKESVILSDALLIALNEK